jgi:diaminopimelate epimerase
MPGLKFLKMSGSGNDFAVFDNRGGNVPSNPKWIEAVCRRGTGVGADGVIALEYSRKADFKMRYYNADGREADFCGNGLRCAARFALTHVLAPREMRVETRRGVRRAEVRGREVSVEVDEPRDARMDMELDLGGGETARGHFLRAEVPHFVVFADDVDAVDVERLGAKIRRHEAFGSEGTNATFAQAAGPDALKIRSFERGIEGETLACGTGSAAAAEAAVRLGLCAFPVRCLTRGGGTLTIERSSGEAGLRLVGPADIVYAGELWDEIFAPPAARNEKETNAHD